ncbi:MAG: hypothetical protein HGB05_22080, partial [Chloroflexi bacterium]|nr:hypothetical protein [Chloroflexota bacterium]
MTFKSIISSVLLLTLLAACGAAPAAPLAPPTLTSTSVSASAGPIPAATALAASAPTTPELTPLFQPGSTPDMPVPEPSVDITAGPWLIVSNARGLQSFSADGTLAQTFDRAQLSLGRQLEGGIAPTGGSVAFIGGDNPMTPDREGSGPLTLNLLNVVDGTFKPVTPLFVPEMEEAIRSAILTGDRTDAVEAGIAVAENSDTLAWSPDGRYLAFIAAIDGPSSDVYSYDRESGTINRLTDGPHQAARLFWSPDSQWIIHEEVENFGTGAGWNVKAVWAAAPDGSGTRKLYDTEWSGDEVFVDWIAPDVFIVYTWSPLGLQDVRVFNLSKDEAQRIGPDFPVQAYAVEATS